MDYFRKRRRRERRRLAEADLGLVRGRLRATEDRATAVLLPTLRMMRSRAGRTVDGVIHFHTAVGTDRAHLCRHITREIREPRRVVAEEQDTRTKEIFPLGTTDGIGVKLGDAFRGIGSCSVRFGWSPRCARLSASPVAPQRRWDRWPTTWQRGRVVRSPRARAKYSGL
jgi:hypothetical protein